MTHRTNLDVAWGDTDAGGLIYYPRFFHYVVQALNDYFAPAFDGAHPMETLRQDDLVLPAVDANASFQAPLRSGDPIAVESAVSALGEASLTFAFRIDRADGGPVTASGAVTFVLVDEAWEATPLPDSMRTCIDSRGDPSELPKSN
jgi:YbgC/YbaW family acyl-CoA thioester hydrolase